MAVHQHMFTASQGLIYVVTRSLEMGSDIGCGLVEDVDAIAIEAVSLRDGDPGHVECVDEVGYVVFAEEVYVVDSGH